MLHPLRKEEAYMGGGGGAGGGARCMPNSLLKYLAETHKVWRWMFVRTGTPD